VITQLLGASATLSRTHRGRGHRPFVLPDLLRIGGKGIEDHSIFPYDYIQVLLQQPESVPPSIEQAEQFVKARVEILSVLCWHPSCPAAARKRERLDHQETIKRVAAADPLESLEHQFTESIRRCHIFSAYIFVGKSTNKLLLFGISRFEKSLVPR
jgi:hypothetical protein